MTSLELPDRNAPQIDTQESDWDLKGVAELGSNVKDSAHLNTDESHSTIAL